MSHHKKKMNATILITVIIIIYYIGFLITILDGIWKYALGIIPLIFSAVMVKK